MPIDLRSDFTTRPTEAMVQAMLRAARLAPGFGPREDPTVSALEACAARLLGKADALFCPTCMLANQIAIHIHCRPGEAFLTEAEAHVVTSESGAAAALSGAFPRIVPARFGALDPQAVAANLDAGDAQRPRTAMLLLENTHVRSGGRLLSLEQMDSLTGLARNAGVAVHLDGARLFNAAVALGVPADAIARLADSVSVNLNKGLGAPLGAILAGDREFVAEAVRVRQMFGGGWRPAGIPAAAGLVALQSMVQRLGEDHARARRLALGLQRLDGLEIDLDQVQSNIVLVRPLPRQDSSDPVTALADKLAEHGVLALPFGSRLRLVIHHEIDDAAIEHTLDAFARAPFARPPTSSPPISRPQ
ncbi:MAG: aminotransferase class I/II-fold pyridoxal phosphate-dependent enzyme [Gammaproteobacteria bacterium]|nr:aminotransferase class I/II-fold pyridoxal phosphate-dependent enzyme [Gammaproteobacteria bacterium]